MMGQDALLMNELNLTFCPPRSRFLTPCNDDDKCEWEDDPDRYMTSRRWYPTLETLEDGSAIIVSATVARASRPLARADHALPSFDGSDRWLRVGRIRKLCGREQPHGGSLSYAPSPIRLAVADDIASSCLL